MLNLWDSGDKFKVYQDYVERWEEKIHSFITLLGPDGPYREPVEGALSGIPFAVKDIIAIKDLPLTCGSSVLKGLNCPYTATAVDKLLAEGAFLTGKTNLDEFGMGSSNLNSIYKGTRNPWDPERVAGGSSGGSAAAVSSGQVAFALGSDTGGSVRQPASFCGIYGLKPTYGAISRYGLTAYASSLDVIGLMTRDISLMKQVFYTMKGKDVLDQTSRKDPETTENRIMRIGVMSEDMHLSESVRKAYQKVIEFLKSQGHEMVEVTFKTDKYTIPTYYTLACAEASANLARFTGIRYGLQSPASEAGEMVQKTRSEGFGDEVQLRILLGTYVLRSGFADQYYNKAMQIRKAMKEEWNALFSQVDLFLSPTFPVQAFPAGEGGMDSFQQKLSDRFTTVANLTGLPALNVPSGVEDGLPCGVQFTAPEWGEERLFSIADVLHEAFPLEAPAGFEEVL